VSWPHSFFVATICVSQPHTKFAPYICSYMQLAHLYFTKNFFK
jgi:hypothetical protein